MGSGGTPPPWSPETRSVDDVIDGSVLRHGPDRRWTPSRQPGAVDDSQRPVRPPGPRLAAGGSVAQRVLQTQSSANKAFRKEESCAARRRRRREALDRLVLLGMHLQPINLVVFEGSYGLDGLSCLVSGRVSHLDAFSGYPFRT